MYKGNPLKTIRKNCAYNFTKCWETLIALDTKNTYLVIFSDNSRDVTMNNQQETNQKSRFRIPDLVGSSETKCEIRGQLRKDIVHSPRFIRFERTLIELV